MEDNSECFVAGALSTVLRVSRYLGTAPLRFVKQAEGWRISLSTRSSAISRVIITVTGIVYMWTAFSDKILTPETLRSVWSPTQRTVRFTEAVVITGTAFTMVYRSPNSMQHLMGCLNQVQKINSELNIRHWPMKQKKHIVLLSLWTAFCLVTFLCDYVAVTIFISQSDTWIKVSEFLYYIHYTVIEMRVILFIVIVLHVRTSFQAVNDCLKCLLRDVENKYATLGKKGLCKANSECVTKVNTYIDSLHCRKIAETNKKPSSFRDTFHGLSSAYGAACCVVRAVNRSEGPILLMMLTLLLQHLISAPYFFVTNIIYGRISLDEPSAIFYKIVLLSWSVLQTFNLLLVIEPCHLTHMEMETTRELVSHLMRCTQSAYDPLAAELEQFYKYLVLNEVSYKPLNVITMSRSLVLKIFGSVTTYLVILIKI